MNENEQPASAVDSQASAIPGSRLSEIFYDRAIWRMQRTIAVCGIVIIAGLALRFGLTVALGATLGVALAWHNFRWLTQAVNALGERITTGQSRERGGVIVFRFTARILLIALGSYAIFKYSQRGLYGYLIGLCVPVIALLCEAAYEVFCAFRRGL
jgi:hypothetical protein